MQNNKTTYQGKKSKTPPVHHETTSCQTANYVKIFLARDKNINDAFLKEIKGN